MNTQAKSAGKSMEKKPTLKAVTKKTTAVSAKRIAANHNETLIA